MLSAFNSNLPWLWAFTLFKDTRVKVPLPSILLSVNRVPGTVLGTRLQREMQLFPQRPVWWLDWEVHLQPQSLGSELWECLSVPKGQMWPRDGKMHMSPWHLGSPVQQQLLLQRQLHLWCNDGPVSVQSWLDREELRDPVQLQQLTMWPVHRALPLPGKTVGPTLWTVLPVC